MALSGRLINGQASLPTIGTSVVIINETGGKSGILRILGLANVADSTNYLNLRIEVDGVVVFDKDAHYFFTTVNSYPTHGMTIQTNNGATASIDKMRRLVNIPFNSSLKVTIRSTHSGASILSYYSADYAIDM